MPLDGPAAGPIHPRWSQHHRPVATGLMSAVCRITRPTGPGTTGPDGRFTPAPPVLVYEGPCRAAPQSSGGQHRTAGDRQVFPHRYDVGIRYDAPTIHVGDTITFTQAEDAGMVGLQLRVLDVAYASEQWQRTLIAQELQQEGGGAV